MPERTGAERTRLYSLELGRFIAAVLVFVCHLAVYINRHAADPEKQIFGGAILAGPLGVQYFFVLSGFVMVHAHHRDFGRLSAIPRFWWSRACRIYPAYWLALLIPLYYLYRGTPPAVALHLASLDPGFMGPKYYQEYVQAAWSLRYEMAFYIMFGLCLTPYIGKPLLAFWFIVCVWRWCGPLMDLLHDPAITAFFSFAITNGEKFVSFFEYYFFAGLAAAFIYLRMNPGRRVSTVLLAVSFGLFMLMLPSEMWGLSFGTPMFSLGMAFIIAGNILGLALLERHGMIKLGKWAGWAGAMSYPLYVLHGPLMLIEDNEFTWGKFHLHGLYAHFIAMVVVTLVVSAFVTFLFDMPLQRALRQLTKAVSSGGLSRARPRLFSRYGQ